MLLAQTFRLLAFTLGAALDIFLAILLATRQDRSAINRFALGAAATAGMWQAARAASLLYQAVAGRASSTVVSALDLAATAALVLTLVLLLYLAAAWSAFTLWAAAPACATAPLVWWAFETHHDAISGLWISAILVAAAALCWLAAPRASPPAAGKFLRAFCLSLLAVPAVALCAGRHSPLVVAASLIAPATFTYFVYRYNLLGLSISRRIPFALTMGVIVALYLLIVRRAAGFLEEEFEVFGRLVELALIFAAAMIWLPLWGWMNRVLSRRTALYADFSKRLIEEAARILDVPKRVQFLAEEVGRTFGVHRVLLVTDGDVPLLGRFGPSDPAPSDWKQLLGLVSERRFDVTHAARTTDARLLQVLSDSGFHYLFALWYEDRLIGALLLDASPRLFLEEDEAILVGLSRQISHSIETGRLVEEKIALERTLARQEHLAILGRAATTIAHEVKNPLSSIKTLVQVMREDPEVERRYDPDLAFILGEVERLNRTVQQLLHFARPAPEPEPEVNLTEVLETTAGVLAREYAAEQIRIEHCIEPQLRMKRASTEALQQVVLNLALNAVQASSPGGTVQIEAGAKPAGHICISVADQGPGVPAGLRERIFEPFFTTKQKGTGLGLAIVRKNVRLLGGEIEVESPADGDRGTRVTVILPAS